jgi:hypothetical protein
MGGVFVLGMMMICCVFAMCMYFSELEKPVPLFDQSLC